MSDRGLSLIIPNYPADAFAGTAEAYAECRPPYPEALFKDLRQRAGTTGNGCLLDLASGPGRVALALAPYFIEVRAQDWEPEMITVGRRIAKKRGLQNIHWSVGRAEEVEAEPESLEMITISEAFHRLDQKLIAKRSMEWLRPGGSLVTMGVSALKRQARWQVLLKEFDTKWWTDTPGSKYYPANSSVQTHEEVVEAAGFKEVKSYSFPTPHLWTVDSILGRLHSSSGYTKKVLGDRAAAFEADLRQTLKGHDSDGKFSETLDFGYTLARRP